jgi:hypothetical protein
MPDFTKELGSILRAHAPEGSDRLIAEDTLARMADALVELSKSTLPEREKNHFLAYLIGRTLIEIGVSGGCALVHSENGKRCAFIVDDDGRGLIWRGISKPWVG